MTFLRKNRSEQATSSWFSPNSKPFFPSKDSPVNPFFKPAVQPKFEIGESNDKYEKEADRVADKVVNQSKSDSIQKKGGEEEIQQKPIASEVTPLVQKSEVAEEEPVQKSTKEEEQAVQTKGKEEESVQMKDEEEAVQTKLQSNGSPAGSSIESRLNSSKGGGQKLSGKTKHEMESGFGSDFSNVNIHTDENAVQLSKDIGAKAFAHGNDVYFNKGQFNPESSEGKHLLAHELTHTIQQKGMVQKKCNSCEDSESDNNHLSSDSAQKKELIQKKDQDPPYELERKSGPSSASIGTTVTYKLKANEGGNILDSYTYNWKVIDAAGRTFYTQATSSPYISLQAKVPGDYIIQVQILNGNEWVDQAMLKQNVYFEEKNTELGGLSVGNFDFKYDGNTAAVEVRVKFGFESGISKTDQKDFKTKFKEAIKTYWSKSNVSFKGNGHCANDNVPLTITLVENESDYHKYVDVEKDYRRPNVISDMNLYLGISQNTIAHEFGHVLGLYDEYDGGAFENAMFWHDDGSNQKDTDALMNTGTELRNRYFTSFLDHVNENAPKKCKYSLKTPFKK